MTTVLAGVVFDKDRMMGDGVKRRGWIAGAVVFASCSAGLAWWDMSGRPWPGSIAGEDAVVSLRQAGAEASSVPDTGSGTSDALKTQIESVAEAAQDDSAPKIGEPDVPVAVTADQEAKETPNSDKSADAAATTVEVAEASEPDQSVATQTSDLELEVEADEPIELAVLAPVPRPAMPTAAARSETTESEVVAEERGTTEVEPVVKDLAETAAAQPSEQPPKTAAAETIFPEDTVEEETVAEETAEAAPISKAQTEVVQAETAPIVEAQEVLALAKPQPGIEAAPEVAIVADPAPAPKVSATVPQVKAEAKITSLDIETSTTAPVVAIDSPRFDLVRVDTAGSALVAGRAAPLSVVRILSDGMEIGRAKATSSGEFVAFLDTVPQKASQILNLSTDIGEMAMPAPEPVILLGMANATDAEGAENTASGLPQAILKATDDSVEFLQPVALDIPDRVSLDRISYDDAADVILVGRGVPEHIARIYVDDAPRAETRISEDGRWRVDLSDVPAGIYTLRVDQIDAAGNVASRSESPFKREAPEKVQLALLESQAEIVVQPGNNLWTIAQNRYGTGFQYHVIYDANRDQIRDPDLIYPGQVFALPEAE